MRVKRIILCEKYTEDGVLCYKETENYSISHNSDGSITEISKFADGSIKTVVTQSNGFKTEEITDASDSYLIMPVRGLLAILIMLCGFASVLVFLNDKSNGKFDWLTLQKQILPGFAQCLSGILLSAFAVFIFYGKRQPQKGLP